MDFSPVFIFMTYNSSREEVGLFDTPQKSRERNPPFSIQLDFTQYRRGRDYTVSILTENYFDAFIIQVRSWGGLLYENVTKLWTLSVPVLTWKAIEPRPVVRRGLTGMPLLLGSGRRCPALQSTSCVLEHDGPRESMFRDSMNIAKRVEYLSHVGWLTKDVQFCLGTWHSPGRPHPLTTDQSGAFWWSTLVVINADKHERIFCSVLCWVWWRGTATQKSPPRRSPSTPSQSPSAGFKLNAQD